MVRRPILAVIGLIFVSIASIGRCEEQFRVSDLSSLSGRVVFTGIKEGSSSLYVLDLDDRKVQPLEVGPGNNSYGALSPDGTKVAFATDRDGDWEIYVADFDGANPRPLTDSPLHEDNPTWSPDSSKVLYYSGTSGEKGGTNLFTVQLDGGKPVKITAFSGRNTTPSWSPNGEVIAYSTNRFWPGWDVCFLGLGSREKDRVEDCPLSGARTYCRPRWSNKGGEILYSEGVLKSVDLFIYDIKTKARTQVTELPNREYDGVWYKDDATVFFANDSDTYDHFGLYITETNLTETKERRALPLALSPDVSIRYPSFAPQRTMELEATRFKAMDAAKK